MSTTKPIRWNGWYANGEPHWRAFPSVFHVVIERADFLEIISSHNKVETARKKQKKVFGSIIIRAYLRPGDNSGGILQVAWSMEQGRVDEVYGEDLSWFDNL